MKVITASKLESLSVEKSRLFQELLPELVKRLIIDSVSDLSSIRMPDCNDIWAPGFDGVVECKEESLYVNSGISVWEFGNVGDSLSKINSDYEKRKMNSLGLNLKKTTYYAVIPKIWAFDSKGWSITKWETSKKDWREVKIYDASVLCDWLNKSPAVLTWLFERIYEDHLDFTTVSKAWESFSKTTEPRFSTKLFVIGREEQKLEFYKLLSENEIIKVKSKTNMDSFGFCLASIMASDDFKNSVIVINDEKAYKKVSEVCKNKILLLKPMEIDSFIEGNKTIICYDNEAVSIEPDILLSPLKKKEYLSALKDMKINENDLEDYYYHTKGELFALVRKIPGLSNQFKPKWSSDNDVKILFPLLFLRNIDINNETDKCLCELLSDEKFDRILSKYNDFIKLDDSPIKRIENIYYIVSYEEAWNVLSPDVEGSEIRKLTEVLIHIINISSGKEKGDWQVRYRAKKYIYYISLNYVYYSYSYSNSNTLRKYIESILKIIWDTDELLSVLRLYAEAEPELVLSILEEDYKSENSHIKKIFSYTGYGSNYIHILSAINILISSKECRIRACNFLFELCKITADYFWHSKPKESLLDALWLLNNEGYLSLSEKKRLALKYLEDENIGIELVFELLKKRDSIRHIRIGSRKVQTQDINFKEYYEVIHEISSALVRKIKLKRDISYIIKTIDCFFYFPIDVIQMFFTGLINIEYDLFDKLKISYTVRTKICLYRKLNKYLDYLKLFEDFIEETERKKWDENKMYLYYDHYYDCPILESPYLKDDYKFHEEEEYIYQYRIDALNSMFSKDEGDMINTSIQLMANEPQWGHLIAASNYKTKYEVVIRSATENKKYYLLSGFLDKIDSQIAYSKIKELSNEAKKNNLIKYA